MPKAPRLMRRRAGVCLGSMIEATFFYRDAFAAPLEFPPQVGRRGRRTPLARASDVSDLPSPRTDRATLAMRRPCIRTGRTARSGAQRARAVDPDYVSCPLRRRFMIAPARIPDASSRTKGDSLALGVHRAGLGSLRFARGPGVAGGALGRSGRPALREPQSGAHRAKPRLRSVCISRSAARHFAGAKCLGGACG